MAKKGLGRGLDSLFGSSGAEDIVSTLPETSKDGITMLRLSDVEPNSGQPRKEFDEEALNELADSIREHGVITPIIVRKTEGGFYTIVAGERRWRASKKAGIKKIPAIIKDISDEESQEIALIENLQRKDLNPVEEALGYKKLMEDFSLTQEQISQKMGKSRSSVANSLRLLSLSEDALSLLEKGSISQGHAKVILGLSKEKQSQVAKLIVKEDMSVRATEEYLKKEAEAKPKKKKENLSVKLAFEKIEKSVSSSLGSNVKISGRTDKGTVKIDYYSSEELDKIVKVLSASGKIKK